MPLIHYKNNITRDPHIPEPNIYLGNGQSCRTIWFKTVKQARAALKKDGVITGVDLADCTKCSCNYPWGTKELEKYPEYLCRKAKEKYADQFK